MLINLGLSVAVSRSVFLSEYNALTKCELNKLQDNLKS